MRKLLFLFAASSLVLVRLPALAQSADEQLAAASALFDAAKYSEAAVKLDAFLASNPRHAKASAAALALGRCRALLKQFDKAVPAYEKALASNDPAIVVPAQLGLGEAAINTRQFEKAANALGAAVKNQLKSDQAPVAWYWLGQANYELKRDVAAEDAYTRVIRDFPKADFIDEAYYGAALAALRQGKTDVARQRLRLLTDRYRKSEDRPQAMLLIGQIDLDGKRYQEARTWFESVLNEESSGKSIRGQAEDGLIQTLLATGDYGAAIPRLESAIGKLPATDPQRFRAQLSLGHARYHEKQYDQALAAYTEASKSAENPVAGESLYWAGNALLALNRYPDAAAQFQKLTARLPNHELAKKAATKAEEALSAVNEARTSGSLHQARQLMTTKRETEAIPILADLLKGKLDADSAAEAQYLLGLAYDSQHKSAPAASALAESIRLAPLAPRVVDAQGRLAWLYLELKKPAEAEKAAAAALALKPDAEDEQQARLAQVQAQLDQQKWDAALEGSRALISGSPPPDVVAAVLFTQAWVSEKRGKPDEALPIWEKLAAEHPRNEYAAQALIKVGDSRLKADKYEEAQEKYQALLTGFPKSALASEARFKLGSALYNLNKPAEAAVEFDAVATDKSAGDYAPEALYWAGVAHDKAGKKETAIQRLDKLVAQYPNHSRVANAKVRLAALKAVTGK